MSTARDQLAAFTEASMPSLDVAVMGALELFADTRVPELPKRFARPLVVGSGNAYVTGTILYANRPAVFATESTFTRVLPQYPDIDGAVLISASGGKHAVTIAEQLQQRAVKTVLLTNNPSPPAGKYVADSVVFPKNREPYTYNTSTYLGMILSMTRENAAALQDHLTATIRPCMERDLQEFDTFTFILPSIFAPAAAMFQTKFDELFGPFVHGRIFTEEEIKHAKTIVTGKRECFVGLGVSNDWYGVPENRVTLPLPPDADFGAVVATGYYAIGCIQAAHPPYFTNNIVQYAERASSMFGQKIHPIVA